MRKSFVQYPFHPFLFSIIPVLILFADNIAEIPAQQIISPLVVVTLLATGLLVSVNLIIKDINISGLIVSPFILLFLSYSKLFDFISNYTRGTKWHLISVCVFSLLILMLYSLYYYKLLKAKHSRKIVNIIKVFNGVALLLILFNLIQIGLFKLNEPRNNVVDINKISVRAEKSGLTPDIYYIILDGYASLSEMRAVFNYDNTAFANYLIKKGFYIAHKSKSKFISTDQSLATSLNMEVLGNPESEAGRSSVSLSFGSSLNLDVSKEEIYYYKKIRQNKVVGMLKSMGYKYIHFGAWWYGTRYNKHADINFNCHGFRTKNEFNAILIQSSVLRLLYLDWEFHRRGVLYAFEELARVVNIPGPKFIFAHIICPHGPYVFGQNGEKVGRKDNGKYSEKFLYINQYIFISKRIEKLVDEILSKSEKAPIIIIQSDHGSRLDKAYTNNIFNAYYLPNNGTKFLNESISPENTFRVIFNHYFNEKYDLIE